MFCATPVAVDYRIRDRPILVVLAHSHSDAKWLEAQSESAPATSTYCRKLCRYTFGAQPLPCKHNNLRSLYYPWPWCKLASNHRLYIFPATMPRHPPLLRNRELMASKHYNFTPRVSQTTVCGQIFLAGVPDDIVDV